MIEADRTESLSAEGIFRIERPDGSLMTYYVLASLVAGPFLPFVLVPLYFRYHTMRYRFSEEGVSMRWGILFRREINLTFARIQDIHLTSNFVERWLGLARIQIQTASGSAKAEMTIEGIRQARALRDFLYARERRSRGRCCSGAAGGRGRAAGGAAGPRGTAGNGRCRRGRAVNAGPVTRFITHVLKVPPQPEPPMGSPGSVRIFNAAPGYYHYRLAIWGLRQLSTLIGLIVGLTFLATGVDFGGLPIAEELATVIEAVGIGAFLVQLPVSFLMVRLDYRYRWYMITDTSLRIREGLMTVRERTMTFANIQNLSLRQGPIQRLFGITDLQVRTAGGGGSESPRESKKEVSEADNMHLGYFRGVDNAETIRDAILARMRSLRDSGLGDPDDHPDTAVPQMLGAAVSPDILAAARELAAEAGRLRATVGG
jgi:membrane protein YdbS with pleckstrin-like domain